MNLINRLEAIFERYFNIMAFLRTLVCVIFLFFAMSSCSSIEYAYSKASWELHQIHLVEYQRLPNCLWCVELEREYE